MKYRFCLVLGAGASVAMGYPVGNGLRTAILEDANGRYEEFICSDALGIDSRDINEFVDAFRASQMSSIDAFLARRGQFSEIGKRVIAAILLDKENKDLLRSCNHNDHWYLYFFNKVAAAHDWESLSFEDVAVVTFNYDRSFEHYMLNALMNSYGRSFTEAYKKLEQMKIVHVYGVLGSYNKNEKGYFSYGDSLSQDHVSIAASRLKVIPEGRNDDPTLQQARELLLHSGKIAFLGFGFDEINLERLNSKETCKNNFDAAGIYYRRKVVGTCYGMTGAEALKAAKATASNSYERFIDIENEVFYSMGCEKMLRETLILD